jgi:hypothetical protein
LFASSALTRAAARLFSARSPYTLKYLAIFVATPPQAERLKAAGATEVVIEYDELPRAALELLAGRPGPARLKRFNDLSTYYRTVNGPASTAGMTVDELRIVASEVSSTAASLLLAHASTRHASVPAEGPVSRLVSAEDPAHNSSPLTGSQRPRRGETPAR